MDEFELRFKKPQGIEDKLEKLGFEKFESFDMHDLIFEPTTWESGKELCPGYSALRIRIIDEKEPVLEMKTMMADHLWEETQLMIDSVPNVFKILCKIAVPRRVISKHREMWEKGGLMVCIDNVKHLGDYIEIEGDESEVRTLAETLELTEPQPVYGKSLFHLEKEGKITFNITEMEEIVKRFI